MKLPLPNLSKICSEQDDQTIELGYLFSKEITAYQGLVVENTQHFATQIAPEVISSYHLPNTLSAREQAILAYYYPFAEQIKADLDLAGHCLSAILDHPITIKAAVPFLEDVSAAPIGQWQLDVNSIVGGLRPFDSPCFAVTVGPLESPDIPSFLPGGALRKFMKLGLCPLFLPKNAQIKILVLATKEDFLINDENRDCFWGINTRIA